MKKVLLFLLAIAAILPLSGCFSTAKAMTGSITAATEGKSIGIGGDGFFGKLTSAIDPMTGLPLPSGIMVTGSMEYSSNIVSIPWLHKTPDSGHLKVVESPSIFNSNAVSRTITFNFTASSPESAGQILNRFNAAISKICEK